MAAADDANAARLAAEATAKAEAAQKGVQTAGDYGISEALLGAYPELRAVYDLFKAGNTGAAIEALYATDYYKNLSATVKARTKQRLEQPGVYADSEDKYLIMARKRLVASGIKMDTTEFEAMAKKAYALGLSDDQFDQFIINSGKVTGFGGAVLGDTTSLKAYAASFGVSSYLDEKYWTQKSKDLFSGFVTTDDIQKELRDKAASAFPAYAEQFNNGVSLDSIASAYKGAMANLLERDADSITFDDPRLRQALQYIGPDGKPAIKPLWQFEKELRSTPEWEKTNNARDTVDSLTLTVFKNLGIA